MKIDEFEFQDRNGNEIEPTKNQLIVYIKFLHKQVAELQKQLKASEQSQNQKTIEVLEKMKDDLLDISSPYWQYFAKSGNAFMTYEDIEQFTKEFIDNQIKELESENER